MPGQGQSTAILTFRPDFDDEILLVAGSSQAMNPHSGPIEVVADDIHDATIGQRAGRLQSDQLRQQFPVFHQVRGHRKGGYRREPTRGGV